MIRALRFVAFAALAGVFGAVALVAILMALSIYAEAADGHTLRTRLHELCAERAAPPVAGDVLIEDVHTERVRYACTVLLEPGAVLTVRDTDIFAVDLMIGIAPGAALVMDGAAWTPGSNVTVEVRP
jgi:hypothetical protein